MENPGECRMHIYPDAEFLLHNFSTGSAKTQSAVLCYRPGKNKRKKIGPG
jgi:hypothetical protein